LLNIRRNIHTPAIQDPAAFSDSSCMLLIVKYHIHIHLIFIYILDYLNSFFDTSKQQVLFNLENGTNIIG